MPTIAAIATAPGAGGIGIVRISGPQSREILSRMFSPVSAKFSGFRPWVLHRGRALDHEGAPLDDVLAVFMPGPRTFTGEDVAEIHCHGGPFIVQAILETALRLGARAAERGEFSRRAFVNGRMDLSQAEAVAELIAAPSREALRYSLNRLDGLLGRKVTALRRRLEELRVQMSLAVDFPDEEVECLAPEAFAAVVEDVAAAVRGLLTGQRRAQVMQQGAVVVLAGAVNAGKSSLLNALLGRNRALVTDIPGTTRDFLEESCQLDGLPVRLTDTAGLRETDESVEEMGVALSRQKVRQADAILLLVDGGRLGPAGAAADICPDEAVREVLEQAGDIPVLLVWNKVDLAEPAVWPPVWGHGRPCVRISASTGHNVDTLARRLRALLLDDGSHTPPSDGLAPNARQSLVLERALHELDALLADIAAGSPYDCCSVRLDAAAALLGEVTGLDSPEEVLNRVFSSFCIGK
ncbi:MAG: tRNA uridine-5-carboxymethylaminomethyl(34) synthesis GTPase MnmE [Desulfovibrio piger]|uniref:tRNA uridine-5-carboxymethylaminomethyl(34) synthesis GTPase MnmE n=1 Tax=Desulfovibrio piger TaxID=901 RepID=UPI00399B2924